jgi:hypothetical protein
MLKTSATGLAPVTAEDDTIAAHEEIKTLLENSVIVLYIGNTNEEIERIQKDIVVGVRHLANHISYFFPKCFSILFITTERMCDIHQFALHDSRSFLSPFR